MYNTSLFAWAWAGFRLFFDGCVCVLAVSGGPAVDVGELLARRRLVMGLWGRGLCGVVVWVFEGDGIVGPGVAVMNGFGHVFCPSLLVSEEACPCVLCLLVLDICARGWCWGRATLGVGWCGAWRRRWGVEAILLKDTRPPCFLRYCNSSVT